MKQKILLLVTLFSLSIINSQEIDGINYQITSASSNLVSVIAKTPKYTADITIPLTVLIGTETYTVTEIADIAFQNCTGLTSVNIPNSVTTIRNYVFWNCSALTSITMDSVTSFGTNAFYNCVALISINIPNSVTQIGSGAFQNCTGLTSVNIPNSVTQIGAQAFRGCTGLTSVIVDIVIPLFIFPDDFHGVTIGNIPLYVPSGSESAYNAAAVWQDFMSINSTLGIVDNDLSTSISIYPNPTKDILKINLINTIDAEVYLYDIQGRLILNKEINKEVSTLDISHLHSGVYILNIKTDIGTVSKKIIKE